MKFHGSNQGLKVTQGYKDEILIAAPGFMQSENQDKLGDYMRRVADELNGMEPFSKEMSSLLQETKATVQNAKRAESFLEEVTF